MTGSAQDMAATASRAPSQSRPSLGARIRTASTRFWLELMFWWAEYFPPAVLFTRPFFLWFAWRYATKFREGTIANARRLLPPDATRADHEALAKEIIRTFYLSVYELGTSVRLSPSQLAERIDGIEGGDIYRDARRSGRGTIIVTAHLGSFELGLAGLPDKGDNIHVVYQHDVSPRFDRLRSRLRKQLGVTEAPVGDGWSMWIRLRDVLTERGVVMIQTDRVMPGQRGVPVPFLGGHILMPTGPLKLALATGAIVVPIFSIRTGVGRVRVVIEKPITVSRDDGPLTGDHPAMLTLAALIEKHVRAHPAQWMMVEPVWCEDMNDARGAA